MYEYKVRRLHRVVDGDTFDLELDLGFYQFGVYRIRLLGVDTPEIYGRNATEQGTVAKQFVEEWFNKNLSEHTICARTIKADSFGRWLADIYIIDKDYTTIGLGEALLTAGLATAY